MSIPFKQIPQAIRVPLFYAEVDNSQANSATANQRTLIIGQITASGTGSANIPTLSQGVGDAAAVGGNGSMLHLMTAAYRASDPVGEVWYLPLADDGAAVAATGSVAVTHVATANGVISLYIAGVRVQVAVTTAMTTAQIATALYTAINLTPLMPVLAANGTPSTVSLTALNAGAAGNDIDIRVNYGGAAAGEATPAGVTYTITAMASGATNPVLTTGLANLAAKTFDSTSLTAIKSFLNDTTGRWSWQQQLYGHMFLAYRGTYGALVTFGATQNNQHQSVLGVYDTPTPYWIVAADYAGAAAVSLRIDPGMPLQTVALNTMLPPPLQSQFTLTQQNTLLYNGISTFNVADDGTVSLQNVVTSYLLNAYNQPDNSYLEIETLFLLMFVIRFLSSRITSKFGRFKLAANGTRFGAGSNIVTPNIIRADQINAFVELENLGMVQGSDQFAQQLIVQQNVNNPNRVDVLWPGTLIDQLRIFAILVQFRLAVPQSS